MEDSLPTFGGVAGGHLSARQSNWRVYHEGEKFAWGLCVGVKANRPFQISHARKIATDIDYLKLNRNNPNIWSSSGRVVHKLRVSLRLAMIAVAEGLQSHFLTTVRICESFVGFRIGQFDPSLTSSTDHFPRARKVP